MVIINNHYYIKINYFKIKKDQQYLWKIDEMTILGKDANLKEQKHEF